MTQPIPRTAHGPIDYLYVLALVAAPFLIGFTDVREAAFAAWAFATVVLVITLLTRAEWGVWRVLPYRIHLLGDVLGSLFMIVAPWLLGFANLAGSRNTFLGFGIFGLVAVALSKPEEMGSVRASGN